MIIKKYIASDLDAALKKMRQELGPESTVLTSREITRSGILAWFINPKVEITAAVEPEAIKQHSAPKTDYDKNLADLKKIMPAPRKEAQRAANDMDRVTKGLVEQFGGSSSEDSLRQVIREEMQRSQKSVSVGSFENNDESVVGSVRFLMAKGVARTIALEIEKQLDKQSGQVDMSVPSEKQKERLNGLHKQIVSRLKTTGPLRLSRGNTKFVALVGSTGVGKTTTLAKIASEYVDKGIKVSVVSLDTVKLGAREQIKALTDRLQIPLMVVSNKLELKEAAHKLHDQELVLIDTAGCNQYDSVQVDKLADFLSAVRHLETCFVMSATTKDVDMVATVKNFNKIKAQSLIFTKMDETIAHGILVNACTYTHLPLRYLTDGQAMSDLKVADSGVISRTILLEGNGKEAKALRELVAG